MKKNEVLAKYKKLAANVGRAPSRAELQLAGLNRDTVRHHFGNMTALKSAAGIPVIISELSQVPSYRRALLSNFNVHDLNIASMFRRSGLKANQTLRMVAQPDTHVPHHDPIALNAFNKFLNYYKPHAYVNLGDFLENEPSSHWDSKTPKARRLVPEIKEAKAVLSETLSAAGKQLKHKVFLMGNHEDWTDQLLTAKIPEIYDGLEDLGISLALPEMLGLAKMGFNVVPINEVLKVGHAHFIHGYYTGDQHSKKHLQVFGVNVYYGHLHDVQSYSGVSVDGLREAMSLGCLRTLNAQFLKGKPNNWSHAFGVFEFRSDGSYTRYCPIIINGKFSMNGVLFDGTK